MSKGETALLCRRRVLAARPDMPVGGSAVLPSEPGRAMCRTPLPCRSGEVTHGGASSSSAPAHQPPWSAAALLGSSPAFAPPKWLQNDREDTAELKRVVADHVKDILGQMQNKMTEELLDQAVKQCFEQLGEMHKQKFSKELGQQQQQVGKSTSRVPLLISKYEENIANPAAKPSSETSSDTNDAVQQASTGEPNDQVEVLATPIKFALQSKVQNLEKALDDLSDKFRQHVERQEMQVGKVGKLTEEKAVLPASAKQVQNLEAALEDLSDKFRQHVERQEMQAASMLDEHLSQTDTLQLVLGERFQRDNEAADIIGRLEALERDMSATEKQTEACSHDGKGPATIEALHWRVDAMERFLTTVPTTENMTSRIRSVVEDLKAITHRVDELEEVFPAAQDFGVIVTRLEEFWARQTGIFREETRLGGSTDSNQASTSLQGCSSIPKLSNEDMLALSRRVGDVERLAPVAKDISILSKRMEDFCTTLSGICRMQKHTLDVGSPRLLGTAAAASGGTAPQDAGRLPSTPRVGSILLSGDSPHDLRDEASNITGLDTHTSKRSRSSAPSSPSWPQLGVASQRATLPSSPSNYVMRLVSEPQDVLSRQKRDRMLQRSPRQTWAPPKIGTNGNMSPVRGNMSPVGDNVSPVRGSASPARPRSNSPIDGPRAVLVAAPQPTMSQTPQQPVGSATVGSATTLSQQSLGLQSLGSARIGESQPRAIPRMVSTPAHPPHYAACQSPSPREPRAGPSRQSSARAIVGGGTTRLMESPRRHAFSTVVMPTGQHTV